MTGPNRARGRDFISDLPDSVISHILSFLPTKSAVATSILSTRWRNLWTSIHNLEFCDSSLLHRREKNTVVWYRDHGTRNSERAIVFINFVDRVLLLNRVSNLQKFSMSCFHIDDATRINAWLCNALERSVQELSINTRRPICLHHMLYTCKTLVRLELWSRVVLDITDSVWFPCLKILRLRDVEYTECDSARKLFLGCPVLEDLVVHRWKWDKQRVFDVSVPTLKSLEINVLIDLHPVDEDDDQELLNDVDELNERECKLVINAPNLEYLELRDTVAEEYLVNDLTSLNRAYVKVEHLCDRFADYHLYADRVSTLLRGLSNIKFLSLADETLCALGDRNHYNLPIFQNLTNLKLYLSGELTWKILNHFLESSPILEVLALEKGNSNLGSVESWSPPQHVPNCLLLHLKEIEVNDFSGLPFEYEAVDYLMKNAKCLKKMVLSCINSAFEDENLRENGKVVRVFWKDEDVPTQSSLK